MSKNQLHPSQKEALRVLLEYAPDVLVSMLVDHAPTCLHRSAAEVLLGMAEWTRDDLGAAFADQCAQAVARELL